MIENCSPVKTVAVGITTETSSANMIRIAYLANQKAVQTQQPTGSIADGSYQAGTIQDTSDIYLWELRPGKAAELTGFVPTTSTIIRKLKRSVDCDININMTSTHWMPLRFTHQAIVILLFNKFFSTA